MSHIAIVGGGIIGMSLSYELARRSHQVTLLERSDGIGQQASWAGAGMLPPANSKTAIHPLEFLTALSNDLHEQWSRELKLETGRHDGYIRAGSLHVARTPGEVASLYGAFDEWQTQAIECHWLDRDQLAAEAEQRFGFYTAELLAAVWLPGAAQFHNPARLEAMLAACVERDVTIRCGVNSLKFECDVNSGLVAAIEFNGVTLAVDQVVIAAGPWSEQIAKQLDGQLPMQPVRGQMVMFRVPADEHPSLVCGTLINEGTRYLVPRQDGVVLAGSTIEEVGFDNRTTAAEIREILEWSQSLIPGLSEQSMVRSWAGLRPATYDGFPYLGWLPGWKNVAIAAGHFKAGLQLSTGTAVMIADLLDGESPSIDLSPFDPGRVLK